MLSVSFWLEVTTKEMPRSQYRETGGFEKPVQKSLPLIKTLSLDVMNETYILIVLSRGNYRKL